MTAAAAAPCVMMLAIVVYVALDHEVCLLYSVESEKGDKLAKVTSVCIFRVSAS